MFSCCPIELLPGTALKPETTVGAYREGPATAKPSRQTIIH